MKRFLVFEGDGNHGTFYTDYIEAENLDEAVEKYKERLTDWTKENRFNLVIEILFVVTNPLCKLCIGDLFVSISLSRFSSL